MSGTTAALVGVFLFGATCAGPGDGTADDATARVSRVCRILDLSEVDRLFGEPAHEPEPSRVAPGLGDETCVWADADPDDPGHLLTATVSRGGEVGRPEPGPGDKVYDLSDNRVLGERAFGAQPPEGGARVVFAVRGLWVDLVYEVLPPRSADDDAIDRLIRTAELSRDRLAGRA